MILKIRLTLGLLFLAVAAHAQQYTISTFAGGTITPTPATASNSSIGSPVGVAVDAAGNVFFASFDAVFKIDNKGVLTRYAGTVMRGFAGDQGQATSALLSGPMGLATDTAGNLYIADYGNQRVRKVTPGGIISTVAGGNPNLNFLGDNGPATSASVNPLGVYLDSQGNLFIAEGVRVRRVSPSGIINTIAGGGSSDPKTSDGGPAVNANFANAYAVVADSSGNVFIADYTSERIRKVTIGGLSARWRAPV